MKQNPYHHCVEFHCEMWSFQTPVDMWGKHPSQQMVLAWPQVSKALGCAAPCPGCALKGPSSNSKNHSAKTQPIPCRSLHFHTGFSSSGSTGCHLSHPLTTGQGTGLLLPAALCLLLGLCLNFHTWGEKSSRMQLGKCGSELLASKAADQRLFLVPLACVGACPVLSLDPMQNK